MLVVRRQVCRMVLIQAISIFIFGIHATTRIRFESIATIMTP